MKKTLLLTLLALLSMTQAAAQEYEYVPFVREDVKWVYFYENYDNIIPANPDLAIGTVFLNLEFKGDTVINGKTYKAMHKYFGDAINEENDTVPVYLREEDKVVYGIVPDHRSYADCPIGLFIFEDYFFEKLFYNEEFVLYDFNDPAAFLNGFFPDESEPMFYNESVDTIVVGKHQVRRMNCSVHHLSTYEFIEGIGCDAIDLPGYTLFPFRPIGIGYNYFALSHVIEDNEIIYKGKHYRDDIHVGIDEVVADKTRRPLDPNYYNLMGQPMGKNVPTTPGIYIHLGKKIVVR